MNQPALPHLPPRRADSHKGDFGRALLIGGSRGMSGAIALSGMAALRGGSGLVQLAVPDVCQETIASFEPSYMTAGLPSDGEGRIALSSRSKLRELTDKATAIGCGPGLGRSPDLAALVEWLYATSRAPAVFDADALNALAEVSQILDRHAGPRVLTPHPGEFRRLISCSDRPERDALETFAKKLAADTGAVVLLKGQHTFVTDGERGWHNTTGNPGMATGGTGDVLTGILVALLCQGLSPFEAAQLGAHLHGLAGDLAAASLGEVSLISSDLLEFLPGALRSASG